MKMDQKKIRLNILAGLSSIPLSLAIQMVDTPLNWLMFFLCFYCEIGAGLRQAIQRGAIVGFCTAIINFIWIINGTAAFTGNGLLLGLGIMLVFCILFSLYSVIVAASYVLLRGSLTNKLSWLYISVGGGCLFVIIDFVMLSLGKGFSTCMYVNYIPFAMNIYAIQPTVLLGPLIVTFVVVMVNYQVAYFCYFKQWRKLFIPFTIIVAYLFCGWIILVSYQGQSNTIEAQKNNVAILQPNISPQISWDDNSGDFLVQRYFDMNRKAMNTNASLYVWPETAIPWNFSKNDAFLKQIDVITSPKGVVHLLGMNTDFKNRLYYNSVYSIAPGGKILGRYDKRSALSLVEKPFLGVFLPFFTHNGFQIKENPSNEPIQTSFGKAGILLCNESSIPSLAFKTVDRGANFLVNPGNDGWFANTYIPKQHFYHSRLRAVENRKDIVVNNNNGYSGLIMSDGNVSVMAKGEDANVLLGVLQPNSLKTKAEFGSKIFLFMCVVLLPLCVFFNRK
ncbi:MAG: apolipoprotein N-acyltransferase [Pseudopedobacter saltans]|uniref:Apolipoprotein N-acyltransferase n=1 Tax=Pseudopedobacter saltans TaxID=151895 RepID=A0A2W5F7J5_9SPHI|nr:MAG: apolipoprotein N-acyltransferase [Pseudopedobacter saltans]